MNESKQRTTHSPGPWWVTGAHNVDCGSREEPTRVAKCWTSTFAPPREEAAANADLIASAPALALVLEMIASGAARLERYATLTEFCFDGLRYSVHGDWAALVDMIGWETCRDAVAKANR